MDVFSALALPTRRTILEILATSGALSATEIGKHFIMSAPAVSQHLKILIDSGLLIVEKRAQRRIYKINTNKIAEVQSWAANTVDLWEKRLDYLDYVLKTND